jgi:hypothetical protein
MNMYSYNITSRPLSELSLKFVMFKPNQPTFSPQSCHVSPVLPVRRGVVPCPNLLDVAPLLGVAPISGGMEAIADETSSDDSEFARARSMCIVSIFPFPFPFAVDVVFVGRIRRDESDSSVVSKVGIRSFCFKSSLRDWNIPSRNRVD